MMAIPVGRTREQRAKQEMLLQQTAINILAARNREMLFRVKMARMENWALDEINAMVRRAKARWGLPHNPVPRSVFRWNR